MSILTPNTVLVPVDFSESSIQALDHALQLVSQPGDVYVLHVLEALTAMEPGIVWTQLPDEQREDKVMQALRQRLDADKYAGVRLVVEFGNPGHCVADYAEKISADLIVIASHGRTGIPRLMLGSVAERVIRLAQCPVLVVKSKPG